MTDNATWLADGLSPLPGDPASYDFVLGLSGGRDSTVLAHAFDAWARDNGVRNLRFVHVDHGLDPASRHWAAHCERFAAMLGRPITVRRIPPIDPADGGLEAAARDARYAAIRAQMSDKEVLLTAHHLDDQCETLLLALVRGAGTAGLAAMPALKRFGPGWLLRPLLGTAPVVLAQYADAHGLTWVTDPSNADDARDRNYLRHSVVPVLAARWPAVARNVARSAGQCAAADAVVTDALRARLTGLGLERVLPVAQLREIGAAQAAMLLRAWLGACGLPPPPRGRIGAILRNVVDAAQDAMPVVDWPGAEVRRYRDRLYALAPRDDVPAGFSAALAIDSPVVLPAGLGTFSLRPARGAGLKYRRVAGARLQVRFRRGGERLRPVAGGPGRSVKKLLNEAGIVPWMRSRLPFVFIDGDLCAIAHLWVDAGAVAGPGEAGLQPAWTGHPALV